MDANAETREDGIDAFLTREHRNLDHTLADVEFLSDRRSFVQAAKRFGEFRRGLEKHVRAEEKALLPLFLQRTGDPEGIVPTLRSEHECLLRLLDEVGGALSRWDHSAFCSNLDALNSALKEHHHNEERLLHPALDSLLHNETDWRNLCQQAHVDY